MWNPSDTNNENLASIAIKKIYKVINEEIGQNLKAAPLQIQLSVKHHAVRLIKDAEALQKTAVAAVGSRGCEEALDQLPEEGLDLKAHLEKIERSLIEQSLVVNDGVVARAAESLSIRRTTLVEKMRKYGMQRK